MTLSLRPIAALTVLVAVPLMPHAASAQARATVPLARPFFFEPNVGQAPPAAAFVARGNRYAIQVSPTETVLLMRGAAVRMRFENASMPRAVDGVERLPGISSYFRGSDPSRWRTGIPQFARVRVADIYRGIDVVYYGRDGALEYDLIVSPGADPSVITMTFAGATRPRVDANGDLALLTTGGELRQRRPVIYQDTREGRREIAGRYVVDARGRVRFRIGDYDRRRPLVIDPVLMYAGYLGGPSVDGGVGVATDVLGYVYITGYTRSDDNSENDAFVAKLDPTGSRVLYAVTLGGSQSDAPAGIGVDRFGHAYIAGTTFSTDFPVQAAMQPELRGEGFAQHDGFITKLNRTGTALVYSSYLGGTAWDEIRTMTVTMSGELIAAGATQSPDFPIVNAMQPTLDGENDAFVAIVNPAGTGLVLSTFFGGSSTEWVQAVAVDPEGGVAIAGTTFSGRSFPLVNPFQSTAGGVEDMFVARFRGHDYQLAFSTLLGGNETDGAYGVAVSPSGETVVSGATRSVNFPLVAPLQAVRKGPFDAVVAKFAPDGAPIFSTLLGGSFNEQAMDVAIEPNGRVTVVGSTWSTDFPVQGAFQPERAGAPGSEVADVFVSELNASGSAIEFSSYFGGAADDYPWRITKDRAGSVSVTGDTLSIDLPVSPSAVQPMFGGVRDAFLARVGPACAIDATAHVTTGSLSILIPFTPLRFELFLMRNQSSDAIGSPISLVLSGLQDAILVDAIGTTNCTGAPGSPFVMVPPGPDGWLQPGGVTATLLVLYQTGSVRPTYQPFVLSGVPGR